MFAKAGLERCLCKIEALIGRGCRAEQSLSYAVQNMMKRRQLRELHNNLAESLQALKR